MAISDEQLTSKIVLNAVLPVIKVMVEDDLSIAKAFEGVTGKIQFRAEDTDGPVCACLVFDNGVFLSNKARCNRAYNKTSLKDEICSKENRRHYRNRVLGRLASRV